MDDHGNVIKSMFFWLQKDDWLNSLHGDLDTDSVCNKV